MNYPKKFDVIVIGGGHAGTEAALAAARMGCQTLLLTHNIDTLGQMSCNPSIGGIGKGHLVKELDAMGGAMALATDYAGIQFRILNSSKGPAVRATRAQADRQLYKKAIRHILENQANLEIFQQAVDDVLVEGERAIGVQTQAGIRFYGQSIVLTAGTFLNGCLHIGLNHYSGGRAGDPAAIRLSDRLKELKLPQGRLKTGTPPRIDGKSIDFKRIEEQAGDLDPIPVFSFMGNVAMHPKQLPCWVTYTNEKTHDIIREGLDRSPMFTGKIEGVGPRYCPSIEDKIHRFADKDRHQIFLEPEGLDTHEYYPNGISTSLPFDVQLDLVRSMVGLENANILRPGYAIEYDYFDPRYLKQNFETRDLQGLFFAGQINGTTGYEEAAAQGLFAGINAACHAKNQEAFYLSRDAAYLGVLIDDLTTKGVSEPYRMFTSRAEYRLSLREDNADARLTPIAKTLGLITEERWQHFEEKMQAISWHLDGLEKTWVNPKTLSAEQSAGVLDKAIEREYKLIDLLKRPEVTYPQLLKMVEDAGVEIQYSKNSLDHNLDNNTDHNIENNIENLESNTGNFSENISKNIIAENLKNLAEKNPVLYQTVLEQVEIASKYQGYIKRQAQDIERLNYYENMYLPETFNYQEVLGLSKEVQQKLNLHQPKSLGQATRISGITPAAVSLLLVHLRKKGLYSYQK